MRPVPAWRWSEEYPAGASVGERHDAGPLRLRGSHPQRYVVARAGAPHACPERIVVTRRPSDRSVEGGDKRGDRPLARLGRVAPRRLASLEQQRGHPETQCEPVACIEDVAGAVPDQPSRPHERVPAGAEPDRGQPAYDCLMQLLTGSPRREHRRWIRDCLNEYVVAEE